MMLNLEETHKIVGALESAQAAMNPYSNIVKIGNKKSRKYADEVRDKLRDAIEIARKFRLEQFGVDK